MPASPLDPADRAVLEHLVREGLELLDAGRLDAAALDFMMGSRHAVAR